MRISIALATYNGAAFLREQLDSFVAQRRRPDELVVSDDASTDSSLQIIEEFSRTSPFPVKVLANGRNAGHERNFERAMAACTGDLIFLSDQDDLWLPDKIAAVEDIFERHPHISVVVNDLEIADSDLKASGKTVAGQIRASGTWGEGGKTFIIGCASAFRSTLLDLVLPIPSLNYGHDRWLHAVAHAIGGRYVLERTLQLYRRHGNNASEWLFDAAGAIGWKDTFNWSAGLDLRTSYANQREVLRTIETRLLQQDPEAYRGARSLQQALSELKKGQAAFSKRIELLNSNSLMRKMRAIMMLGRGDYRYFLGLRSFAKDLMR